MSNIKYKILVIRFSSIGDIVLTSPIVRCIHKQLPNAEIYFLTKKQFQPIVQHNENIHRVILFDNNLNETIATLKDIGFQYIVDLHNNLRSRLICAAFPLTKVFRFNKLNTEKWLLTNFKINRLPQKHIVDRYFEAIAELAVVNDNEGLDFFIPSHEIFDYDTLSETYQKGFVVFSIGGQHNTKKMPLPKWHQLALLINSPIIILGGKEEQQEGEDLSAKFQHVINYCGKLSLLQSASILAQSKLVVTHDTGLMHIAAAFKKPIVSVWGNTIPEFGMYPYYGKFSVENYKAEIFNLNCRPCSKLGHKKCPEGHFKCMEQQDVTAMALFVKENLGLASQ